MRHFSVVLATFFALLLVTPAAALAQTTTPPTTTALSAPAQTTAPAESSGTSGDADEADRDPTSDDRSDKYLLAGLSLLLCALLVGGTYWYLTGVQSRAYATIDKAIALGEGIPDVEPLALLTSADRGDPTATPPKISGPAVIARGERAEFTATSSDDPSAIAWSVRGADDNPTEGASVAPGSGPRTTATATALGTYALTATDGNGRSGVVFTVIAPAARKPGRVAFVGTGWGTLTIVFAITTLATALAFVGVLDGTAIAALFGTIVGYGFIRAAARDGGAREGDA